MVFQVRIPRGVLRVTVILGDRLLPRVMLTVVNVRANPQLKEDAVILVRMDILD